MDNISEHVQMEDNVTAQQQTLMWDENKMLHMAPGEKKAFHVVFCLINMPKNSNF